MRCLLLLLIASVAVSASGQAGSNAPKAAKDTSQSSGEATQIIVTPSDLSNVSDRQEGCPVHIVSASFERPGRLIPVSRTNENSAPTLRLDYRNASGKDIESVVLTGWIKVKDSPYQLDSVTQPFNLALSRKSFLGKDVQATETLNLGNNALGLDRIELSQVIYIDGTTWKPERRGCVYPYMGSTEGAKAW